MLYSWHAVVMTAGLTQLLADGGRTLHTLNLEKYPFAKCLDGSPGAFYFWPSTTHAASRKWVIHHVGGGWCSMDVPDSQEAMVDSCLHRSTTARGSSNTSFYARNASVGWTIWGYEQTMVPDPVSNPMLHDWNKVALVYCDGGSFSGRNRTIAERGNRKLHFRGGYILDAIMDTLLQMHGLNTATDVVIGGASAGGLATFLHLDQWRAAIPESAFVVGLPDSGFFQDWSASKPVSAANTYAHELRLNFWDFNVSAGVNTDCVAARVAVAGDPAECYFAEHTAPFIKSPIFALQSTVDAWQLSNELGSTNDAVAAWSLTAPGAQRREEDDAAAVNAYRLRTISRLQETLLTGPGRGGFVDSCVHHTGLWDRLVVNGTKASQAFVEWYMVQRSAWAAQTMPPRLEWWQAKGFPCTDCCGRDAIRLDSTLMTQTGPPLPLSPPREPLALFA